MQRTHKVPRSEKAVVLVTCGSLKEASSIARELVERRLAACVNIMQAPIRSTYRWKEKVETATEYLLLIKTAHRVLPRVQAAVARLHSYEVPEFIALPILAGSPAYLKWLEESLAIPSPKPGRGRR